MVYRVKRIIPFLMVVGFIWTMATVAREHKIDLIFSHKKHIKMGFECLLCHSKVSESIAAKDDNLPEMDTCLECHEAVGAPQECAACHLDPDNPKPVPRITIDQIIFSHKNHLQRGIDCSSCHRKIDKVDIATVSNLPRMKDCLECHRIERSPDDCMICHRNLKDKLPKSHRNKWLHLHQDQAKTDQKVCASCHRQDFCQRCHQGDNLSALTHDLNYVYNHSLDVRGKEAECISCHEAIEFCSDCHRENMVLPLSHSRVDWSNRITGDGGQHKVEARTDLESCVVCHETGEADPICADCHR